MKQWIVGVGAVLFVLGCSGPDRTVTLCTPGTTLACLCGTSDGSQICDVDGRSYGVCTCDGVDSGTGGTDSGIPGTDAPIIMSDTPTAPVDPIEGRWCAPVAGWTTSSVYTFEEVSFTIVVTGDIPSSESFNGGCHVVSTARGTYSTASGVLSLTFFGTTTDDRTGCDDPADNGAWAGTSRSPESIPYSVGGGVLTLGSGASGAILTSC